MTISIPSLTALRAFEAAIRHRSMTRAGNELFVTHGAISRHVRALERTLGVDLFNRDKHTLEPTAEGLRLAEGLANAFSLIEASIDRVRPTPLTLSCSSSIMMEWIIPRIGDFHRKHPSVELQFNMNYDRVDFVRDKIGIAIRSNIIEPPPDAMTRDLGSEEIGLVCAPAYQDRVNLNGFDDLSTITLLGTRTRSEAFGDWKKAAGFAGPDIPTRHIFEHFYLLIQAAIFGLGVGIVPHVLVADHIAAGRLVAPFGFHLGPRRLVLWVAAHLAETSDLRAIENWLIQEMKVSNLPTGLECGPLDR